MAHAINLHSSFWHVSRGGRKRYLRRMKYVGNAFLSPREYCKLTLARARFGTAHSRNGARGRRVIRGGEEKGRREKEKKRMDARLCGTSAIRRLIDSTLVITSFRSRTNTRHRVSASALRMRYTLFVMFYANILFNINVVLFLSLLDPVTWNFIKIHCTLRKESRKQLVWKKLSFEYASAVEK